MNQKPSLKAKILTCRQLLAVSRVADPPALTSAFRIGAIELRPQRGNFDNLGVSRRFIRHFGSVVLRRHQHFKHTTPLAHSSVMIRLHSAEFIRLGEYDYFGTASASIQLRNLDIATQTTNGDSD